jgi:hypothetical protein
VLPFIDVSFSYCGNAEGYLYKKLEFGIDCDSRIALVGPNGAGGQRLPALSSAPCPLPSASLLPRVLPHPRPPQRCTAHAACMPGPAPPAHAAACVAHSQASRRCSS